MHFFTVKSEVNGTKTASPAYKHIKTDILTRWSMGTDKLLGPASSGHLGFGTSALLPFFSHGGYRLTYHR